MVAWFTARRSYASNIRPLNPHRDLEALATLIETAFGPELALTGSTMVRDLRQFALLGPLLRVAQVIGTLFSGYVWIEDDELVGNVSLSQDRDPGIWHLSNVAVLPEFRGRGIAGSLVDAATAHVRRCRGKRIMLQVRSENTRALAMYRHRGFATVDVLHELNLPPRRLAENPTRGTLVGDQSSPEGLFQPQVGRPGLLEALQAVSGSKAGRRPSMFSRKPLSGWASSARLVSAADTDLSLRQVRAQDWRTIYQLVTASTPRETLHRRPVSAHQFRRGLAWRVRQCLRLPFGGERQVELVGVRNGEIVAYGSMILRLFRGLHELQLHVLPNERGRWELGLVDALLWSVPRAPRVGLRCYVSSTHPEALRALAQLGFETLRVLDQMSLELN